MARWLRNCGRCLVVLGMSGWLFQAGCARSINQELEVLFATEASPTLLRNSFLVNWLGLDVLRLFNR